MLRFESRSQFSKSAEILGSSAVVVALCVWGANAAHAQQAPATPPAAPAEAAPAAPPPIFSIGGFDLTGHIDAAYTHLSGYGKFVSGANDRVFDFEHDAGIFHTLDLMLSSAPDSGFGGTLEVNAGKDADTIASYGTIDKNKGPANGANHYFDVTQAYFYYAAAPMTLIAGKFATLAGAEVISSAGNTNYSRSILFGYAIPFTHTGLRTTWKVNDSLSLVAGVNQGWDAFEDPNSDKTVELAATYTPSKTVTLIANYYGGKELVTNYPKSDLNGMRNLLDLVGTFNLTDQLTLVLNYDYGDQDKAAADGGKAKWQGIAGYLNYQFNDQWRVSGRAEYFDDKDGYRTGVVQKWKEGTLTVAYMPAKPVELRLEGRYDKSDVEAFLRPDGVTPTGSQSSYAFEVLYKF
ncbi:MAG TPA: outer membrane beta-barrel protein [Usitatibacter sp.]|nr:outer membrane beta-barrel protein [Usitatibacter sp.]